MRSDQGRGGLPDSRSEVPSDNWHAEHISSGWKGSEVGTYDDGEADCCVRLGLERHCDHCLSRSEEAGTKALPVV